MSEHHSISIPAHHNIYTTGSSNRELRIDFSTPQNGINEQTGLLILVPGFGGNIDSKVYIKMRELFPDIYNLVTIQCDYFGSSYMQSTSSFNIVDTGVLQSILTVNEFEKFKENHSSLLEIISKKTLVLPVSANINENVEEFNDMGYMQAIDIISAIEAVKILLVENNLKFNLNRIIGYGHSHGAYLLHLSNRFFPNLFSYIVDNSAWIEPVYLTSNRYLYQNLGKLTLSIEFDYLAKRILKNKNDLNLTNLYKGFKNNTQILSFQGDNDSLVNHFEKKLIIKTINNSDIILVGEEDIDNIKYKSNTHGLDADFLELFSYAIELERPKNKIPKKDIKYDIDFDGVSIKVNSSYGLPIFNLNFKLKHLK